MSGRQASSDGDERRRVIRRLRAAVAERSRAQDASEAVDRRPNDGRIGAPAVARSVDDSDYRGARSQHPDTPRRPPAMRTRISPILRRRPIIAQVIRRQRLIAPLKEHVAAISSHGHRRRPGGLSA